MADKTEILNTIEEIHALCCELLGCDCEDDSEAEE